MKTQIATKRWGESISSHYTRKEVKLSIVKFDGFFFKEYEKVGNMLKSWNKKEDNNE